ncbi:MAG TPA: Uma2 family endonuclease [Tepidisphaeraceae bacterium]|nr:Uma2 family endonuclease [Tepidisphaeraceae bacterium]
MTIAITRPRKRRRKIVVGPGDDGRHMSLDDFDDAEVVPGYSYELGNGLIEVSNVPAIEHGRQVEEIRDQLGAYGLDHAGAIDYLSTSNNAKLLIGSHESERHPDLMVYLSPAPEAKDLWSTWVPELVIEVVSKQSAKRDYEVKPAEYLALGVSEYWIVDGFKSRLTILTRWRGQWKKRMVKPTQKVATPLLPGFTLDLKRVFAAARRK